MRRETPVSQVSGLDRSGSAWLAMRFGGSGRSWGLKKQSRVDPRGSPMPLMLEPRLEPGPRAQQRHRGQLL